MTKILQKKIENYIENMEEKDSLILEVGDYHFKIKKDDIVNFDEEYMELTTVNRIGKKRKTFFNLEYVVMVHFWEGGMVA